jgi:hypothetical protein
MQRPIALACAVALAACATEDRDEKLRFIEKAHHALHPAAAPLTPGELDALVDKDRDDIVATLYKDPQTRDAVFRLSLAFLGAPIDELHSDGRWAAAPFGFSPAVSAARAFREGKDPLLPLLTTHAAIATGVVQPVDEYFLAGLYPDVQVPLEGTSAERRAIATKRIVDDIANFRAFVAGLPDPFDQSVMCAQYEISNVSFIAIFVPQLLGIPQSISDASNPRELDDQDAFPLDYACFFGDTTTRADALAHLDHARELYATLGPRLEPVFAQWEANPEGAFDPVDFGAIGFDAYADQAYYARSHFYPQFWQAAQNSSTNYDRRRGAYVLDRFFCDDLKPVGAALPTAHVEGKHASDPSCAACHFKLDPMAGFFRRHGYFGIEFDDQTLDLNGGAIIFDDFASLDYREYETSWRAPTGAGREFDVGYIRSTRDAALNSYGSNLADLDQILRTAPEVERCFVQRAFEYFNGADQAVDPGFLDDVTAGMRDAGGDRLEHALSRILAGETFRAPDRNSTVCYDVAPGTDSAHSPPCEVASILRAHCATCHSGGSPQGGLDVTSWDGSGFRHVVGGAAVPRADTFARMLDRVTTSDVTRQMPQGKDMPLRAREQLALWLQSQID